MLTKHNAASTDTKNKKELTEKAERNKVKIRSSNLFPVVGIGASAGGLEAFKSLLRAIPEESGMAYILVQHLHPGHQSILVEILQKVTTIPVVEITNNVKVEADHIYIIPINKLLTATDGILQLTERLPKHERNMPIDLFFRSLAEVHQSHAIGVVLSGTANDGTLGLKAIKERGGITIAQESESAAYDSMPQSAIDAGVVDFILSPEDIPGHLLKLNENINSEVQPDNIDAEPETEEQYLELLSIVRYRKGVDFSFYKQSTIRRRIDRRIALSMKGSITEYIKYLDETKSEQDMLYQDLLIPVTRFFRDPAVYEILCKTVFPTLLEHIPPNEPIRIWVAGCSTGEEAYSILICLNELLKEKASVSKIQLFATDISDKAIVKARAATYSVSEVHELSPLRLQTYFTKLEGKYQLNKSIRDSCVFANHNFIKDPPFAHIDLISCRNALIYVEPILQKTALTTFHYALKENGYLVLGKSESITHAAELFHVFDSHSKIFTRKSVKGNFLHVMAGRHARSSNLPERSSIKEVVKDDFQKKADDILLSDYTPPGVVVNKELDIVQFRGATSAWLEPAPGKPDMNILKMAKDGLAFELRNALYKCRQTKKKIIKENIPVNYFPGKQLVTIEVIPLIDSIDLHFLVLFREVFPVKKTATATVQVENIQEAKVKNSVQELNVRLVKELAQTRKDMREITDDQEASNENLQSANEELLSSSEELQSLNEELETSKEEIQTSNEELIILNQELNDRNERLNFSRLYSESIVSTIREPLIILNNLLEVKSANKSFYNKFQTTEEAIMGRPFFELENRKWDVPDLRKLLEEILPRKTSILDFQANFNFASLGDRVLLINATQIFRDAKEEQAILMAIEDITEKAKKDLDLKLFADELEKQVLERTLSLNEANIDLQHSNQNLEQFAYIASHDLQEPLRKIRTFSSILDKTYSKDLPPNVNELIKKINYSAERMSALISAVLNYSKLIKENIAFEKVNLNDTINQIINDFDVLIEEKQAVITCDKLPVIEGIPLELNLLFSNLVSNALKFSKQHLHPVISISSRILSGRELNKFPLLNQEITYCQLEVRDNGIGFDQAYAEKIFLIFHRLNGREKYPGTGIGLSLCKSIVYNHHGQIYAQSENHDGASFELILPLTQLKSEKASIKARPFAN